MTVYRIVVASTVWRVGRTYKGRGPNAKGAYTAVEPVTAAFDGWISDQSAEPWRLTGSGSFCYAGALRAIAAARQYLRQSATSQVQIRTNQDRKVLIYNKAADGRVTHYAT